MSSLRTAIHAKSFPKPTGAGIVNLKMANGGMVPSSATLRSPQFYTPGSAGDPHASTTPMLSPLAPLGTITPESAANLPRPGAEPLKMQVGGQVPPTSLRGMFNSAVDTVSRLHTSPAEKRTNRVMAAPVAAPAPTPVTVATPIPAPAPVQEIAAPMGSQSVLARREAAAGLRNGGPVGGKGQGDKVPAMLEPNEFVVSNDMMDDNPSLRGALHEMRERTLAKKGMTPAEADAKAVHFEGNQGEAYERAAVRQGGKGNGGSDGHGQDVQVRGNPEMDEQPRRAGSAAGLGGLRGNQTAGIRIHALDGIDVSERPWNGSADSRVFAAQPGPGNPNIGPEGSNEAKAWRKPATMPVDTGVAPSEPVAPTRAQALRGSVNKFLGAGESAGDVVGAFKNVAKPIVGAGAKALQFAGKVAAPLTAGAAAYQGLNTDTETYAKRFGLENTEPGFARDLGVRALGVASDIGNDMTFGLAKKYLYRDGESGDPSLRTPQGPVVTPKAAGTPSDTTPIPAADVMQEPSLRGPQAEPMDWASAKAQRDALTQKDIALGDQMEATRKGKEAEHAAYMESNDRFSQDLAAKVDREREKQAAMTDSKSIDPRTAALGSAKLRELAQADNINLQQRGETLRATQNANAQAKIAAGNNAASLRGHQISADASMYGADVNARTARANALREAYFKDRDFAAGRSDKAFEQQQKGNEAFEKSLAAQYPGADGKGDPVAIGVHRQMATNHINDLVQTLLKNGDKAGADMLAQAGPGALDTTQQAKIRNATLRREAVMKANGWTPGSGNFKDSTHTKAWDPIGYEKRVVGGDHVLLPDGKHVSVNDLRNTPFYNPTGGTTDFDDFIREAQAAEAKRKGAK